MLAQQGERERERERERENVCVRGEIKKESKLIYM